MMITHAMLVALTASELLAPIPFTGLQQDTFTAMKGSGTLQVTLRDMASDSSAALGSTRVPLLAVNLAASCDADIRVDELDVQHTGAGAASDISGVVINDTTKRLTRSATFDRSGVARLRLINGLTVKKCTSVDVTLAVSISSTAGIASEHGATITKATNIQSSAKTVQIVRSSDEVKLKAVPGDIGVITVNMLKVPGNPRYGRVETVARLQISADAASDHLLKKITLTNTENARDYQLMNLFLQTRDGKQVSLLANHMNARQVSLIIDPSLVLKRSETLLLELKAEIRAGAGTKVGFVVEDPADVEASAYHAR